MTFYGPQVSACDPFFLNKRGPSGPNYYISRIITAFSGNWIRLNGNEKYPVFIRIQAPGANTNFWGGTSFQKKKKKNERTNTVLMLYT